MKNLLILGIILLGLVGCTNEPMSKERIGKDDGFEVEYLFEKDGVKVYRFWDVGHYHYFTTGGETMTQQQEGKSSYPENINRY